MSTEYRFKKISDVGVIETANESAHVIIEDAGILKRMAAKNIGAVKTVNGAAPDADGNVVVEVEAGASSWNDLTDKPFYDNGQEVEVSVWNLDSAIFSREENPDNPDDVIYVYWTPFEPEVEIEYTVTINGQTFSSMSQEFYGMNVLGNLSLIEPSLPDSGEPFIIIDGDIVTTIPGETHSVNVSRTISAIEKEIKPEANVTFTYVEDMGPLPMNTEDFDFSSIKAGDMLKVSVDGTEYVSTVQQFEGMPVFGSLSAIMPDAPYTNEPYFGGYVAGMSMLYYTNFPVTFSIDKKIDESNYQSVISNKNLKLNYDSYDRMYWNIFNSDGELELEAEYKITFNGYEYAATASSYNNGIVLFCDANDEFEIFYDPEIKEWRLFLYYIAEMPESFNSTIHIIGLVSGVKKLDKKYIDIPEAPVASYDKEGVVKVYDVWSGLDGRSEFSPIYLDSNDNRIYAKRPTMSTLTFKNAAGIVTGSYNGSNSATITLPTGLPTVSSTYNGKVLGVKNGAWNVVDAPSGLPTVTTANNGKILGVSNGAWTVMSAPSGLPTVTTANNGAFLRIINGVATWDLMENAEDGEY